MTRPGDERPDPQEPGADGPDHDDPDHDDPDDDDPDDDDPDDDDPDDDDPDEGAIRWPVLAKVAVAVGGLTVLGGVVAAVIAAFFVDTDPEAVRVDATDPVALVAVGDRVVFAERTTGVVRGVADDGTTTELARVVDDPSMLATDGQRGVLGLAAFDGDIDALYASWTRADDGRLVVGRVGGDLVWEGPVSTEFANGGTLAFRGDQLLVGIGELQAPDAVADPATPNGKVLALDPDAPPDQRPTVVAGGWHNPFALAVVGDDVWLFDNAPGDDPERLVRIAPDGSVSAQESDRRRAPSALAHDAATDELLVCGFVSGVLERLAVPADGVPDPDSAELVDEPGECATGVAVTDSTFVAATASSLIVVDRS